jgi:hypothetical protein
MMVLCYQEDDDPIHHLVTRCTATGKKKNFHCNRATLRKKAEFVEAEVEKQPV